MITYQREQKLTLEEFRDVLSASTLGDRRPINDEARLGAMLKNANLIVTARRGGRLVGVARALTDYSFCTYLSDLAVSTDSQRQGIGKGMIEYLKTLTPNAKLILLSAPAAVDYYPKIGMERHPDCFVS